MNTSIQEFITGKRIAIVGASRTNSKNKFGNMAATELKRRGYEVYLVHPQAASINGEAAYPSLSALTGRVDGVLVSVSATRGADVLREAAAVGIRNVWVQQGGESPELIKLGEELKLNLVTSKCILMYAQPVRGPHKFHRFFARLAGQL
jgi:predicted CoA-binding protein